MEKQICLIKDVHLGLPPPLSDIQVNLIRGSYNYYHYLCDGIKDKGWGCGYRTLQTICSWININTSSARPVPSLAEIQQVLVQLDDKPYSFAGSRGWIGSFEVFLVIDKLYNIPSNIIHVDKGSKLIDTVDNLISHFAEFGSPVMMGGDQDCSSKGILGVSSDSEGQNYLLVLDPHYVGRHPTAQKLQEEGWVKWQILSDFIDSSFYNLCLPQTVPSKNL